MHRLFLLGVLSKVYVSNPIPGPYIWWEGEGEGEGGAGGATASPQAKSFPLNFWKISHLKRRK